MSRTLTAHRLRELLHFAAETGEFTRLSKPSAKSRVQVGSAAGDGDGQGYVRLCVDGQRHRAHRLAWLYVYGVWPSGEIDHINGVRSDNRIANLRDVPRRVNRQNERRARKNNSGGLLGARWQSDRRKWTASIKLNRRSVHLGQFDTQEAAHAAYLAAKRQLHEGCTL